MHCGPEALLVAVYLTYWPINGKTLARSIVYKCIPCFKLKPIALMSDLLKSRVILSRQFLKCGIDFEDPLMIKTSLWRNSPLVKG